MLYPYGVCSRYHNGMHSRDITLLIVLLWLNIVHLFQYFLSICYGKNSKIFCAFVFVLITRYFKLITTVIINLCEVCSAWRRETKKCWILFPISNYFCQIKCTIHSKNELVKVTTIISATILTCSDIHY